MSQFHTFSKAVNARFNNLAEHDLFTVAIDNDEIWATYLAAFPPGSNPIFRKNTEHDCSCCRHFIRDIGGVVAIQNGSISTIWDLMALPEPYQTVADKMAAYVRSKAIDNVFLVPFSKYGHEKNNALIDDTTHTFHHFFAYPPKKFQSKDFVAKKGEYRTTFEVFKRGLTELRVEAFETVLDLINSKALYRGEEHVAAIQEFWKLRKGYMAAAYIGDRDLFIWANLHNRSARFRNTVIGTLLVDLSDGVDLEKAVKSFEAKVAPANYKRPTALITKAMVQSAMKTLDDLGLEPALHRRHATFADMSVTSVLFVDRNVRGKMKNAGTIENLLMKQVKSTTTFDPKKATPITMDKFVASVLPKTTELKAFVENKHMKNFVSITAPVADDSPNIFKWDNGFAWSYDGNVTDSLIKERVKAAGGQVENVALRVSLAWQNFDDLDLHVRGPNRMHIWYGDRGDRATGGYLDVDMNAGSGRSRTPVENIRWRTVPKDGDYTVDVNQYSRREKIDVGFTIEIEESGRIHTLTYEKAVSGTIRAATIQIKRGEITVIPGDTVTHGQSSRENWGVKTLELVPVSSVILSPNHWGDHPVGNKHHFFILDGCKNPEKPRGIYNEFLKSDLEKHRKVFEILGDQTKCPVADDQMSGVGFSSTVQADLCVLADNRAYQINFGA